MRGTGIEVKSKYLGQGVVAKGIRPCVRMDVMKCNGCGSEKLGKDEVLVGNDGSSCQEALLLLLLHENVRNSALGMEIDAPCATS